MWDLLYLFFGIFFRKFNMKYLNVDLLFHHGSKWTLKPQLLYEEKYVHSLRGIDSNHLNLINVEEEFANNLRFIKVKQVLVKGLSENLILVQHSDVIRILQELLTEEFLGWFIYLLLIIMKILFSPNIVHYSETYHVNCEYGIDAESESDGSLVDSNSNGEYDFDELEFIKMQKKVEVNDNLSHYKELHLNMTFRDLNEAKKVCNLYALATKKALIVEKSDRKRLRYICIVSYLL
ncbi:hypothetical protein HAX54_030603 [Datura stramonium]|uniref:Uncharacterized protein n=1 Tax=Datura stramonium TaxID=4076 RepID=A0ABS8VAU5_DATST|nr:hypothetical protein [Datura stramonium]